MIKERAEDILTISPPKEHEATRNACKLCNPLGASMAFKGMRNTVPFLHGSQGCSTYIRRYMISHFKEPIDIACSNFSEQSVVFGGQENLRIGLQNIERQYAPELIGVASTCLSETIGDDVSMFLQEYRAMYPDSEIPVVHVSTPSYQGTHIDGFHNAVKAVVKALAFREGEQGEQINLLPGMVSPADLRYLREIVEDFYAPPVLLPDYSETLDGGLWNEYHKIPQGGTSVEEIRSMGSARGTIEFGKILACQNETAGLALETEHGVPCYSMGLPIGVEATDELVTRLEALTQTPIPQKYIKERSRLLDAYADGHKYVRGARAVVYGEEDLVVSMAFFLHEIGVSPVLCASGGKSGHFRKIMESMIAEWDDADEVTVRDGADFLEIEELAAQVNPTIFIGSSKGYSVTRKLGIPLVRVGFPIHDRFGGPRVQHLGYRGAQQLFDRIANAIIEQRQESSGLGYSYI